MRRSFPLLLLLGTLSAAGCGLDLINSVIPDNSKPDLRPALPQGSLAFCAAGPSAVVTIENRGDADADASVTTFVFVPGGSVDVQTPQIKKGDSVQLSPLAVPPDCFVPDCRFAILTDSSFLVDESDEDNNRADGLCPASVAPAS
jgi:CARDB